MRKIVPFAIFLATFALLLQYWWAGNARLLDNPATATLAVGRLTGFLATYLMLAQLVLIGRVAWVEKAFGLDRLSRFHHWNGLFLLLTVLLHPAILAANYANLFNRTPPEQMQAFLTSDIRFRYAFAAVVLLLLIAFLSVGPVRRRLKYEGWYYLHLTTYAAILLPITHQLRFGGTLRSQPEFRQYWIFLYIFAFGNLIFFRFIRPLWRYSRHRFRVEKVERETDSVTSVYLTGRQLTRYPAQAGQFAIYRFLTKPYWWQAHPFSFSAVPDGKRLRITIKNLGDFTALIPQLKPGTPVLIDGPHGTFTAERSQQTKVLLIAGGIGITPLRSLAEVLLQQGKTVTLLYANRTAAGIVFRKELEALARSYPDRFTLHHILSDDPAWKGERGRLDQPLLEKLVPDLADRDVYLCGPKPMLKSLTILVRRMGVPRRRLFWEKFSL
jgi:predicted ferric reductase